MKDWLETRRPLYTTDKDILANMRVMPVMHRILLGGEIANDDIGDVGINFVLAQNDLLASRGFEPLFVSTKEGTTRMTRFSETSRNVISKKQRIFAMNQEAERLGLNQVSDSMTNFYRDMLLINDCMGKYLMPGDMAHEWVCMYLNAVLLFNKPWFADVPPAAFFCCFSFRGLTLTPLTPDIALARNDAAHVGIQRLTSKETDFLYRLNEK